MPVAAVAETVMLSAMSVNTAARADDVPVKLCVPVNVLFAVVTGRLAPAKVVAPVPPLEGCKTPDVLAPGARLIGRGG